MAKVISYTLYGPVMIITEVIRLQGHYILGPIWVYIGLDTVGKVLVDFVVFDRRRHCCDPCDARFSQIQGNGPQFRHIELSNIASSVQFSNSVR